MGFDVYLVGQLIRFIPTFNEIHHPCRCFDVEFFNHDCSRPKRRVQVEAPRQCVFHYAERETVSPDTVQLYTCYKRVGYVRLFLRWIYCALVYDTKRRVPRLDGLWTGVNEVSCQLIASAAVRRVYELWYIEELYRCACRRKLSPTGFADQ